MLKELFSIRNWLLEELVEEQKTFEVHFNSNSASMRKRHNWWTAIEINWEYECPYNGCGKPYGSEGSMNLHMKLKHHGGNKTDRDKLAK